MNALLLFSLLTACSDPAKDSDSGAGVDAVDLRLTEADISTYQDGDILLWGPDVVVPPYTEQMWCLYGTWAEGDAGITRFESWEGSYGHHIVLTGTTTSDVDAPDGSMFECTTTEQYSMENLEPITLPNASYRDGEWVTDYFVIPDNMAAKIDDGQRYVLQSHFVNTSDQPVRLQDVALIRTVPEDSVETWVAPIVTNTDLFSIPAQSEETHTFDCTFGSDYYLTGLLGHMHEWGSAISIEMISGDTSNTLFEIAEWDPTYRDISPVNNFEAGTMLIPAGTTIRTSCTWYNDTDTDLIFPSEMCSGVGFVYPALTPEVCSE